MLASIWSASPWIVNGSSSVVRSFRATATAASASTTFGQEHAELVPAEPRDRVALAEAVGKAEADLLQQLVAAGVAKGVVDLLEAVEVDEHHAPRHVLAARER